MWARLRLFITALVWREQFEDRLSDELRFHLDAYAEDLIEKLRTGELLSRLRRLSGHIVARELPVLLPADERAVGFTAGRAPDRGQPRVWSGAGALDGSMASARVRRGSCLRRIGGGTGNSGLCSVASRQSSRLAVVGGRGACR